MTLEFHFTIEDEMSEQDIELLWRNTQNIQRQFNNFSKGKISEDDFCDCLRHFDIDPDEIALIYENNLKVLGHI